MASVPVAIFGFPSALPGREAELAAKLQALAAASRKEKGCLVFEVYHHPKVVNRFSLFEKFASQAALDLHFAAAHTKEFFEWFSAFGGSVTYEIWSQHGAGPA